LVAHIRRHDAFASEFHGRNLGAERSPDLLRSMPTILRRTRDEQVEPDRHGFFSGASTSLQ
jgi:hypothetical protein